MSTPTNQDAKEAVITRLLEIARFLRRRGSAEMANAALPYERQLETDLAARKAELAQLPGLEQTNEVAA